MESGTFPGGQPAEKENRQRLVISVESEALAEVSTGIMRGGERSGPGNDAHPLKGAGGVV